MTLNSIIKSFDDLPIEAQIIAAVISEDVNVGIAGVSVGPDREQTIWRKKP